MPRASPQACLLIEPAQRALRVPSGVIQVQILAPLLHHALVVDLPQVHNHREVDLPRRLELARSFWTGSLEQRAGALGNLRSLFPGRQMLVLLQGDHEAAAAAILREQGELLAQAGAVSLWSLSPPPPL